MDLLLRQTTSCSPLVINYFCMETEYMVIYDRKLGWLLTQFFLFNAEVEMQSNVEGVCKLFP